MRIIIYLAVMAFALLMLFCILVADGQAQSLPDAPSEVLCQHATMDDQGIKYEDVPCPQNKTEWRVVKVSKPGPRWWTVRADPNKPLLYSNKQTFTDPTFLGGAAAMFSCEELARTRTHSESEPYAALGVFGISYLAHRAFGKPFSAGAMFSSAGMWCREWRNAK